ncbi:MAG: helix-turn-helix domain-containing protein, partial [Perlucidibaca sp.]
MSMSIITFPQALRSWRLARRHSQLDLALTASVSQRHLSWLESGKAMPSRQMVLQLAEALDIPLRERNDLLQSAGFAPAYGNSTLDADALAPVHAALEMMLAHHAPLPALVVDRDWRLLRFNTGISRLLQACGLDQDALARIGGDPVNVLRLTLHPDGLGPFIVNRDEVLSHLVERTQRERLLTRREEAWLAIADLVPASPAALPPPAGRLPVLPLELRVGDTCLSLFTTLTTFGTPQDVTTDE